MAAVAPVTWTLALDAALGLATALVYGYVGGLMRRREASDPESRRAIRLFGWWWHSLAALMLLGTARSTLGALGVTDLALHTTITYLTVLPLVMALASLLYYLLYIYTGSPSLLRPVFGAHALMLLFFLGLVAWMEPSGATASDWSVTLTYERPLTGLLSAVVLGLVLAPVLAAAIGYGTLAFRTDDPTSRYRIGVVSSAFILWFGSSAVASATALGEWYWWPVASRLVGLLATAMVLAAYRPPGPVRAWLGVAPVPLRRHEEEVPGGRVGGLRPGFPTLAAGPA